MSARRAAPLVALGVAFLATALGDNRGISDLPVYEGVWRFLDEGRLPYRDFEFEYPPVAAALFGIVGVLGGYGESFAWALGVLMLACGLATQIGLMRLSPRYGEAAAWSVVALAVLFGPLIRERFDLLPVAVLVAALAAATARRPALAGGLFGLGIAVKLFPGIGAAVAAAWLVGRRDRQGLSRLLVTTVAVAVALMAPFAVLEPDGFVDQFTFHMDRPVQVESTPASVLYAIGDSYVTGEPAGPPDRFKSNGLAGGAADEVALIFALLQIAALAAVVALILDASRRASRPAADVLVVGTLAGLLAFVALGKVLSPQYMAWLLPLAVPAWFAGARVAAVAVAVATFATAAYFPERYFVLLTGDSGTVVAVGARNLALVVALIAAITWLARDPRPK